MQTLQPGDYCYLPLGTESSIRAPESDGARLLWTKRRYEPVDGIALPAAVYGNESEAVDIVPRPQASTPTGSSCPRATLPTTLP